MPAPNPYTEIIRVANAGNPGITLDFGQRCGAYTFKNLGTKGCWMKVNGIPAAANGNGQKYIVAGGSFAILNTDMTTIGVVAAGGESTDVECSATPASQSF